MHPMGTEPAAEIESLNDCRQRYLDNMASLYRRWPRLALEIERIPFAELPPLERTRDGRLTVKVSADDGRDVYVHSKYRPAAEARTLIDDLDADYATALSAAFSAKVDPVSSTSIGLGKSASVFSSKPKGASN